MTILKYKDEDLGEVLALLVSAQSKLWKMTELSSGKTLTPELDSNDTLNKLHFFDELTDQLKRGDLAGVSKRVAEQASLLDLEGYLAQIQDPDYAMVSKLIYNTLKVVQALKKS